MTYMIERWSLPTRLPRMPETRILRFSAPASRSRGITGPPRKPSSVTSVQRIEDIQMDFIHARSTPRSEEHTSELQSRPHLVCRLLLENKKLCKTAADQARL